MIVGFVIREFNGFEKEAVSFIQRVCILNSPDIAQNIVDAGPGVNIFSNGVSLDELQDQPFSCVPIEVSDGEFLIASAVDFFIELTSPEGLIRLAPANYFRVPAEGVVPFLEYERQGLVKVFPEMDDVTKQWLLKKGSWDDSAYWTDSSNWKDDE